MTARLAALFLERPAAEWVEHLGPRGAAVNAVNRGTEVVDDPHNRARGTTVEVSGRAVPANPIRVVDASGSGAWTATGEPPLVGQHTDEALAHAGFVPGEIEELRAQKVL